MLHTVIPLMLVRLYFSTLVFLVIISQIYLLFHPPSKRNSETNDISFESPNIELPESEIKLGVASSRGLPHPLRGDYLSRETIYSVITVCKYTSFHIICIFREQLFLRPKCKWLSR